MMGAPTEVELRHERRHGGRRGCASAVSKVEVIARNPSRDSQKKTRGAFEPNFIKILPEISEIPSGNFNVLECKLAAEANFTVAKPARD